MTDDDANQNITCKVSFTDQQGFAESKPSAGPAIGAKPIATITGTKQEEAILTANISNLFGNLSYVWKRSGSVIDGENSNKYTLVTADANNTITVEISTDIPGVAPAVSDPTDVIQPC